MYNYIYFATPRPAGGGAVKWSFGLWKFSGLPWLAPQTANSILSSSAVSLSLVRSAPAEPAGRRGEIGEIP